MLLSPQVNVLAGYVFQKRTDFTDSFTTSFFAYEEVFKVCKKRGEGKQLDGELV